MNGKRWTAALLILCMCVALLGAAAEPKAVDEKKGGKVVRRTWVDESNMSVAGPEGYAAVTFEYSGKTVTERYEDAEGNPFETAGGYSGRSVTRDAKKRITEIRYLDAEGQLTMNAWKYARLAMSYTSFGSLRRLSYYGTDKKRTVVPALGYAAIECDYRGTTLTGRTYLNAAGKPVDTQMGYATMIQKVNKKNQVTGVSYQHADGSPALCPDGWSSCEITRDDKGRETARRYYGTDGRMTDRGTGYAREEIRYPSENEKQITRYDTEGNAVVTDGGYVTLVQTIRDGKVIRERFLDASGQRVTNREGAGEVTYEYGADGAVSAVATAGLNP